MRWVWIDRILVLEPRKRLVAIKHVSLSEDHIHDHFAPDAGRGLPAMPLMPASLIIEGMAQSGGILVGHANDFREKVVLAKVSRVELDREAPPGGTLRYTAVIDRMDASGASVRGTVELLDHAEAGAAHAIGRIDLIFSHLDKNMSGMGFPEHNFVFGESFRTLLLTSGIEVPF